LTKLDSCRRRHLIQTRHRNNGGIFHGDPIAVTGDRAEV
jgi:hypothetical protein